MIVRRWGAPAGYILPSYVSIEGNGRLRFDALGIREGEMALRRLVMPERTGDSADRKTRPNRVLFARGVPTQQYWEGEQG